VPANERGVEFWYRVSFTENGVRHDSPARRFQSPVGPSIATIELTIVHDAYDHDLTGILSASGSGATFNVALPGTRSAYSSDWVTGESTTGSVSWSFRIEVPQGSAGIPTSAAPWWLRVDEGGYLNRDGRITQFDVIWHGAQGDVTYDGGPLPLPTVEGNSVFVSIPQGSLAVGGGGLEPGTPRFGPNPVMSGARVSFAIPGRPVGDLEIFDLAGRRIASSPLVAGPGGAAASWLTRDAAGRPLAPGIYLARWGARGSARVVVVRP
jgi:hypothetical protein